MWPQELPGRTGATPVPQLACGKVQRNFELRLCACQPEASASAVHCILPGAKLIG